MLNNRPFIIFLSVIILASTSCKTGNSQTDVKGFVESRDGVFPLWPDPSNIPVCWIDNFVIKQEYKDEVQRIVTATYGAIGFQFTGWGLCPENSDLEVVHLKIRDTPPPEGTGSNRSGFFGTRVSGVGPNVYLHHAPYWDPITNTPKIFKWGSDVLCPSDAGMNCARNYALHEFGHVLGLHHEANRIDNDCDFSQDDIIEEFNRHGTNIGDYDPYSIMNYCHNKTEMIADRVPELSELDILTLQAYYHSPMVKIVWSNQLTGEADVGGYTVTFAGKDSSLVKYVIGGPDLDCNQEDIYSDPIPISDQVEFTAKVDPTAEVKICALGGNEGAWQPLRTYSAMSIPERALVQ